MLAEQAGIDHSTAEAARREVEPYREKVRELLALSRGREWEKRYLAMKGLREINFLDFAILGEIGLIEDALRAVLDNIVDAEGRVRRAAVQTLNHIRLALPGELYLQTYLRLKELGERFKFNESLHRSLTQAMEVMECPYLDRLLSMRESENSRDSSPLSKEEFMNFLVAEAVKDALTVISTPLDELDEYNEYRRRKIRNQPISRDIDLRTALQRYDTEQLMGMLKALKIPRPKSTRKRAFIDSIASHLTDISFLKEKIEELNHRERAAIAALLSNGGILPRSRFVRMFGDDSSDPVNWLLQQPKSLMGRLKAKGLILEGAINGKCFVLIPRDLLPMLETIFAKTQTK